MKRYGSVIELKEDQKDKYIALHADVWPEVKAKIIQSNIVNYSIFMRRLPDKKLYLFSYFEYVGNDYEKDMQGMAEDPLTLKWWDVCKPCHKPLEDRGEEEWWASTEEIFHMD